MSARTPRGSHQHRGKKRVSGLLPRARRQPLTRSEMMARIRSKDTKPETLVRSALHRMGTRFRNHADDLPGKPDLVNRRGRWAIFVHGCYWHSHEGCPLASKPRSNQPYWTAKLSSNAARDRARYRSLQDLGYRVFVIWECETRDPETLSAVLSAMCEQINSGRANRIRLGFGNAEPLDRRTQKE